MNTPANRFKAALAEPGAQIGLWVSLGEAYTAELCATAGFDWLLIDGEHGPNDVRSVLAQLQAVAAYPVHPVVRVVNGEAAIVKQMLDIGATTLLVPMIDTAEQARTMVAATRYPPEGVRGVGSAVARASRFNAWRDYLGVANDEIGLLVQVESKTALGNVEAIAAVDGVHGVFIGPADLSSSMGHRGNPNHPEVQAAIEGAIATILAAGKAPGILTGDIAQARRYIELGCRFVAVGVDVLLFANAVRALAAEFKVAGTAGSRPAGGAY